MDTTDASVEETLGRVRAEDQALRTTEDRVRMLSRDLPGGG